MEATQPILYGTVFVLLALTFLLNLSAIALRSAAARAAGTPPRSLAGRIRTLIRTASSEGLTRSARSPGAIGGAPRAAASRRALALRPVVLSTTTVALALDGSP